MVDIHTLGMKIPRSNSFRFCLDAKEGNSNREIASLKMKSKLAIVSSRAEVSGSTICEQILIAHILF